MGEIERLGDIADRAHEGVRYRRQKHSFSSSRSWPKSESGNHLNEREDTSASHDRSTRVAQSSHRSGQRAPAYAPVSTTRDACPICKGAGYRRRDVLYGHPDFGKAFPCRCKVRELREHKQKAMIALCERLGFQRSQVLGTFRPQVRGVQEAVQEAQEFIACLVAWAKARDEDQQIGEPPLPPERWLRLQGPAGSGKSHLSMAIVNACIDAGIVALFATVPALLQYLRSTFSSDAEVSYEALFGQLRNVEVLALDDLGTQQSSPWAKEQLFELFNYRYNGGLPTIISLNSNAWNALDDRIQSRLQDIGLVRCPNLDDAQDYRQLVGRRTPSGRVSP